MKILLVEDSPTIRYKMCHYITSAGHEPITAESGEQAVQILETTPVEMIIMDVEMPGLDGFETTRLVREALGDHWIPIIFVTGKSEDASLEEGIAAGGDDYLIKPISPIILQAKIRAMERITGMRNELSALNKELTVLSQKDSLTQLYNRRTFEEKAQEIWELSCRNKHPVTILLLDIDHFKAYNDTYGHPTGDECIREVAQALKTSISRPGDVVARYGGEEFIAILSDTPDYGARHVTENIRHAVESLAIPHISSQSGKVVTVSIGASVINFTSDTDLKTQIEIADQALYESKQRSRNCATVREFNARPKIMYIGECDQSYDLFEKYLAVQHILISSPRGDECLALAEEYHPNLILIDRDTAELNVEKLCRELSNNPCTSYLPVILVGNGCPFEMENDVQRLDIDACIAKPIDPKKLLGKIQLFLPQYSSALPQDPS